ncbi:MAG: hypothetical protein NVSMB47_01410 [Polyangiales bacterium]
MPRCALLALAPAASLAVAVLAGALPALAAEPGRTSVQLAGALGYVSATMNASATQIATSVPVGAAGTIPATGPTGGSGTAGNSGFSLGGQVHVLTPYYGAGLPRALLLAGVTGFFGRSTTTAFASLHPGGGKDTGATLKNPWSVDLAIGASFPLCRSWSCLDLRVFVGATLLGRTLTVFTDETSDGGGREERTSSKLRTGPLLGALLGAPLCGTCGPDALRVQLGALARSTPSSSIEFTTGAGRGYSIGAFTGVEVNFTAGLLLPL